MLLLITDLKSVSVEGDGVADVETLLRRVSYGDARAFPTPGRRNVHVATTITYVLKLCLYFIKLRM